MARGFITITRRSADNTVEVPGYRLNLQHVLHYHAEENLGGTFIVLAGDTWIYAIETPEDIDRQIEESRE
jgi:hypothetical protein